FLAVGAPDSNGGQVFTYIRTGTSWSSQATLTPPDPVTYSRFGESLAYDSFRLLVGRPYSSGFGSAYLFTYRSITSTWLFALKFSPSDASGDGFGESVALSGTTAFVGFPGASDSHGAVSRFTYDIGSGTWTEQPELVASDMDAQYFGNH